MRKGGEWIEIATKDNLHDAQVEAHNLRHMGKRVDGKWQGWHASIQTVKEDEEYIIWGIWGRTTQPRCCYMWHRNGVNEPDPGALWVPLDNPILGQSKEQKRIWKDMDAQREAAREAAQAIKERLKQTNLELRPMRHVRKAS